MDALIQVGLQLLAITIAFTVVLMIVAYTVLAERRVLAFIQGRLGPNRVGYGGMLQPFADLLKFILKEEIVPDKSTKFVYFLAPIIAITAALMPIIVYPFGLRLRYPYQLANRAVVDFPMSRCYVLGSLRSGSKGSCCRVVVE